MGQAEVLREWVRLAQKTADKPLLAEKARLLGELYEQCGCEGWLHRDDPVQYPG